MANMTFKANLLPNSNLGYSLGSSDLKWKINDAYVFPMYYTNIDYSSTSVEAGAFTLNGQQHPVTGITEYGSVLTLPAYNNNATGYNAQIIVSSATGQAAPAHMYIRRLTAADGWSNWSTILDNNNYSTYLDGRYVTLSTTQRITGAKTFTQPIYFETGGGTTRAILAYSAAALNYGITYKEGNPDVMTFSASGNANNMTNADLSINGLGNGILSHLGNYIPHTGNTTGTVGGASKPVYVNAGTITACSSTIGSGVNPIYISSGTFTASNSTVGSGVKPVFLSSGTITASGSTVGSGVKPIFLSSGTITASGSTAGGGEQPIYLNAGTLQNTTYALKATVNNSTATYLTYYSGARAISGTSNARIIDGCLNLYPANSSYREGIRIHPVGNWSDITLMGADDTAATSGISANSWFLGNNNGTLYLARGSSTGGTVWCHAATGWSFHSRVDFADHGSTSTGTYGEAAVQIREYNYGGAQDNTWGIAPRLAWHWSGRKAAQIGLSADGYLYEAPNTGTSYYKIVINDSGTYSINISGNANSATYANYLPTPRNPNSSNPNTWTYGAGTFYTQEFGGASNTPDTNWWLLGCWHSPDARYGAQIALGMTTTQAVYYRRQSAETWGSWLRLWRQGDAVTGAVWNDYAECRTADTTEPGYVWIENGDDTLSKSIERLQAFAGVSSDTWGFSEGETKTAKTHIAVAGRVLVYTYQNRNNYKPGDCVCAAPGGTIDIMTRDEVREWPDRIVGIVSCVPNYEEWGGGELSDRPAVKVDGRIWIKVK